MDAARGVAGRAALTPSKCLLSSSAYDRLPMEEMSISPYATYEVREGWNEVKWYNVEIPDGIEY